MKGVVILPRSPFDRLRVNGCSIEIASDFPFVLSLSKHERRSSGTFHLGKLYVKRKRGEGGAFKGRFFSFPAILQAFGMLGFSGPSCPRRRASRRCVPYSVGLLDSRLRGNDDSALFR